MSTGHKHYPRHWYDQASETSPGVQSRRYRVESIAGGDSPEQPTMALLRVVDPPEGIYRFKTIEANFLPMCAAEHYDLGDSALAEIPHVIEYEITVRRLTPPLPAPPEAP